MRRYHRTAAVLAALVGAAAGVAGCSGSSAAHGRAASSASPSIPQPAAGVQNPTPDLVLPDSPGGADPHLTHPAAEPWSQLLAPVPAGWTVYASTAPLSLLALSTTFGHPAAAKSELKFYNYQRGVQRSTSGNGLDVQEQLWQFDTPRDALSWFDVVVSANEQVGYQHNFTIASSGGYGFLTSALDSSGNHYGLGVALVGDIIVRLRLDSSQPVTASGITAQLALASAPVKQVG